MARCSAPCSEAVVLSGHDDVTVVITNYDYGRFLPGAVASALAQHGGPPHVVVVDDGSTEPGTEQVLAGLPPAVVLVRQYNAGPSAARNAGWARATTPLLLFLDADDELLPGALDSLKQPLRESPGLGFAYGLTRFTGAWQGVLRLPPYSAYRLLYRHMIGLSALVRADVLRDTGGFDPFFRGYEDWELWVHALDRGWTGRRVDVETLLYRRHPGTSINVAARREYRAIYARLREKHAPLYARSGELARREGVPAVDRLVYPHFWGRRPVPAALEQALHALLWRSRS